MEARPLTLPKTSSTGSLPPCNGRTICATPKRIDGLFRSEARRIDAQFREAASAVGLACEKASTQATTISAQTITRFAEGLRAQLNSATAHNAESINVLREAMDSRLKSLEQNQYRSGGEAAQRSDSRSNSQWLVGILVAAALIVAELIMHYGK